MNPTWVNVEVFLEAIFRFSGNVNYNRTNGSKDVT